MLLYGIGIFLVEPAEQEADKGLLEQITMSVRHVMRRLASPAFGRGFASVAQQEMPTKIKVANVAVACVCVGFIGSVYGYSVLKMKQQGDDISEEIEQHEALMKAASKAPSVAAAAPSTQTK